MKSNSGKANLFIVGAAKAGTSTLHTCLSQHPDICMSNIKEPNFFSSAEVNLLGANLGCPFQTTETDPEYQSLFDDLHAEYVGEASVSYLSFSSVAKKISEYNPDSKILISLRDPLKRAVSHHSMDTRLGICKVGLEEIVRNPNKYPHLFEQYISVGKYSSQIQQYLDVFDARQIHFVDFDDLCNELNVELSKIYKFLGLMPVLTEPKQQNEGVEGRSAVVRALYKHQMVRSLVKRFLPGAMLKIVRQKFFTKTNNMNNKSEKLNALLYELFRNDLSDVERLLGLNLDKWRVPYA